MIRTLRREVALCEDIAGRSGMMREHIEIVKADEEKTNGKVLMKDDKRR